MDKRTLIGRKALKSALEIRIKANYRHDNPICIYDFAEKLGISVWFQGGGSFGGMYSKTSNTILVPSLRPVGRQAYTCAHELAHWHYGHGSRIDCYADERVCAVKDEEEYLADMFAGHLLMPPGAVTKEFNKRSINPNSCTSVDFYKICCQLNVGYNTLLNHMLLTQKNLTHESFTRLNSSTPKSIRKNFIDFMNEDPGHVVLVDEHWHAVPIDLQVGHVAVISTNTQIRGESISKIYESDGITIIIGKSPGISSITNSDLTWSSFVRVSRKDFQGRCIYRHLEEEDDE